MATKSKQIFSTLFFISVLVNFLGSTMQDQPCPYPCYPSPTSPSSGTPIVTQSPPATLTPPSPSGSGSGSRSGSGYSYPPPSGYYPSPAGNLPYYPSPPYGNNFDGHPPPDPILPYFPYYYRKPPHKTDDQSSSATRPGRSTVLITVTNLLVFIFLFTSRSS